jgi:hypothetical protein
MRSGFFFEWPYVLCDDILCTIQTHLAGLSWGYRCPPEMWRAGCDGPCFAQPVPLQHPAADPAWAWWTACLRSPGSVAACGRLTGGTRR